MSDTILVGYATRSGSTWEIAEAFAAAVPFELVPGPQEYACQRHPGLGNDTRLDARREQDAMTKRSSGAAVAVADSSWRPLYTAGGAAALLYIAMIIVPMVLVFAVPQPTTPGGAALLQYIAATKPAYIIELV